jgi:peptide/nickel transport system substrate-binding protein
MNGSTTRRALLLATGLAAGLFAGALQAQTIKLIPQADLKVLDPVFTTANITSNHGYMIYDNLFSLDDKLLPQPQMVDTYSKSADGLVWSFKLRDGLTFHDGSPVRGKDAALSIKRWAVRIAAGQTMMTRVKEIVDTGPLTFEIRLNQIFGPLLDVLATPENPLFVMREKEAMVDPNQQVTETIGSGPFTFVKEEWAPGNKVVYKKFANYKPRPEPASGFAGGKVVKVDRVEWIYIPDTNTAAQALLNGEMDAYEIPPIDLLPIMRKDTNIVVRVLNRIGNQGVMRPNHLIPPFNNVKARQALLYLLDEQGMLAAMVGDRELEKSCWSVFVCGTQLETTAGLGDWARPGAMKERAKQLLAEAGYKGEKIVVMDPTDQQVIHNMTLVTTQSLREAGVNVDLQAMDWSTLVSRRPVKDAPEKNPGGWHLFHTWGGGNAMGDPIANTSAPSPCHGNNWFGWPCDEELEKLRLEYLNADGADAKKKWIEAYQARFYQTVPYVPIGQFLAPVAYRKNLSGVLEAARMVFWNVEKK